jgi:hypothetical protein
MALITERWSCVKGSRRVGGMPRRTAPRGSTSELRRATGRSQTRLPTRASVACAVSLFYLVPVRVVLGNYGFVALAGLYHGLLRCPSDRMQEAWNILSVVGPS